MKKILIVSTWRSGSSFLGELINSAPGVFYTFEPLHFLQFFRPKRNETAVELLRSVFDCRFSEDYLRHMNHRVVGDPAFIEHSTRVWDACQVDNKTLCLLPDFVNHLCAHSPVQLVKEVRLTLTEILQSADDQLIDENNAISLYGY